MQSIQDARQPKAMLSHSGRGIASAMFSVLAILSLFFSIRFVYFLLAPAFVFSIIGIGLAIAGFLQAERKKLFCFVGLLLSFSGLLAPIIWYVMLFLDLAQHTSIFKSGG